MCLLIELNADTRFTDTFLDGVFKRNSDGIGVMWAEDGVLHYYKALPKDAEEARGIFREYAEGKHCCVHYRMRTHGDIDLTNCHPYPIAGFDNDNAAMPMLLMHNDNAAMPMLLMHNGVLSTGNSADASKSDTWHYINDYVKPTLAAHPDLMTNAPYMKMMSAHIGNNNKFAIMDAAGNVAVLNRQAGVEYEGSWLSNTYAWDYYGLHPKAPVYTYPAKTTSYGNYGSYLKDSTSHKPIKAPKPVGNPKGKRGKPVQAKLPMPEPVKNAVQRIMDQLVEEHPDVAEKVTFAQVRKIYTEVGMYDAEDFFDMFFYGSIDEATFLECLSKPLQAQHKVNENWLETNGVGVGL
mgnify:CR=1 FL=1